MKKSLFAMGVLLLSAGMILASCGKSSSTNTATTGGGTGTATGTVTATSAGEEAPKVDVAAGKTGFIVKIAFDGVTCPDYVSIWLTGCMDQVLDKTGKITSTWKTGLDATEMKAVSGHEGWYYGESDTYSKTAYNANLAEGVAGQPNEYSLVLGYNSKAEIADAKKGLQWVDAYKATYCASFAYPNNAKFDGEGGEKALVTLHADTFTAVPKKPEAPLTNYTVKVAFSESLPTYEVPHFLGSFDGWLTTYSAENEVAHRMVTTDTNRKMWTFTFASIIPDSYDITMSLDYTIEAMAGQSNYSWTKPAEWKAGNLKMSVNSADGNNFVMADADAFVATISSADGSILADPTISYDYTIELVNSGTAITDSVYLSGNITAWDQTDATKMTVDATGKIYTFAIHHTAGAVSFRFLVQTGWSHCVGASDGDGDKNFNPLVLPAKNGKDSLTVDMTNVLTENVLVAISSWVFTAA